MADFSFNIPKASADTSVFNTNTNSFFDGFSVPVFNNTNKVDVATMAQAANTQLDGQPLSLDHYMSVASSQDGENTLRTEVASKEKSQASTDYKNVLTEMIGSGKQDSFLQYMLNTSIRSTDMLKRTNLERQTAQYLTTTALSDSNGGSYYINKDGTVKDKQLSMNETWIAESLLWNDAHNKLVKKYQDAGILVKSSDVFGLMFAPLGDQRAWAKVVGSGAGSFYTSDIKKAQAEMSSAIGNKRLALVASYIDKFMAMDNPVRAIGMVDTLKGTMDWRGKLFEKASQIGDTVNIGLLLGGGLAKSVAAVSKMRDIASIAKVAGAREAAIKVETASAVENIVSKTTDVQVNDTAINGVLHSGLKKGIGDGFVDTASSVGNALDKRIRDFKDVLENGNLPSRLTPEEQIAAVSAAKEQLASRAGNLATDLTDVHTEKVGRTLRVDMYIGSGPNRTETFISKDAAQAAAVGQYRMGEGSFSVVDNGDGFFIKISKDVSESGFITPLTETKRLGRGIPVLKRLLGARSQQTKESFSAAILGQNTASRLQKLFVESMDTISALPRKSRDEFLTFAQTMHDNGKWMNSDEMKVFYKDKFNRLPSEKDVTAYNNYVLANNVDYWVKNAAIRRDIVTNGYENIVLDGNNLGIAKEVKGIQGDVRGATVYDKVDGTFYDLGSVTKEKIDELLKSDRFTMLRVPTGYTTSDGKVAQYVITARRDIKVNKLPIKVLNYQSGGHRIYSGEHFAKQQSIFSKNGMLFSGRAKTMYNFESVSDANKFAEKANLALDAFRKARSSNKIEDIRHATEVIQKELPLWGGYGRVLEMVQDGAISDGKITIVRAGKDIPTPSSVHIQQTMDLPDSVVQIMDQKKFWYQKARGDHLRTIVDVSNPNATEKAVILDPLGALDRSANQATKMFGFGDYKARQVEQWMKTYGQYLDNKEGSPLSRFLNSNFSDTANISATDKVKANAWRDAVNRTIGTPTVDQKIISNSLEGVIDFMDRTGRSKWAKRFRNFKSKNPVTAIKGLVFDHFMALDPSQLFVQLSMLPGIIAVGGKNGLRSASSYSLLRLAMLNDTPEVLDRLANVAAKVGGIEPTTFKLLWKDMKSSGVLNVMDTQADIATFGKVSTFKSSILAHVGYYAKKVRGGARLFFNEAERGNKGVSYSVAWLENFDKTGKGITSPDVAASIAARAEALAGNMTTVGRSNWQRGIISIPTQFQAFPIRVMELLLTDNAGFSKKDKIRFLTGLGVTYGAGGIIPFGSEMADSFKTWYTNKYGEQPSDTIFRTFKDGMMGMVMSEFNSVPNLDISRMQPFANSDNNILFQAIMGKKTFQDVMLGPAGSLGVKYLDDIKGALWLKGLFDGTTRFDNVPYLASDLSLELIRNLAGVNRAVSAYILYSTGKIKDKKGRTVVEITNPSFGQIVGTALGLPPIEVSDTYQALIDKKTIRDTQKEFARKIVKSMLKLRDLAADPNADPNDIKKAEQIHNMWWDMAKAASPDVQRGAWEQQIANDALSMVGKDEVLAQNLSEYFRKLHVNVLGKQ